MLNSSNLKQLDNIYQKFGYELKVSNENIKVYTYCKRMYFGAEIILLKEDYDISSVKEDFAKAGFAVKIRHYNNFEEGEETLFDGFFEAESIRAKNVSKYKEFVSKQSILLGKELTYQYINSPFNIDSPLGESNIIQSVSELLNKPGATLIIIEAAAGFGKTCSVYELLNEITSKGTGKSVFFTELSRNREAKIFKYVLLEEWDREFPTEIRSDLVKHYIFSGRIPLIIDGFDELLSKEDWQEHKSKENFEQVETMLTTIADLLQNNAKIILTSRKTAIFTGNEFNRWIEKYHDCFEIFRFNIEAPRIEDWIGKEKHEVIKEKNIPLKNISNPVLLAFLKHLNQDEFQRLISSTDSILDKYFDSLLEREKERQNLLLSTDMQLSIFKKMALLFTELDITAESKSFVKEIIIDYNRKELEEARKNYPNRPSLDELGDALVNHALLDRKDAEGNIGFINDFILGSLIGDSICEPDIDIMKYKISQHNLELAFMAYKYHSESKRKKLWEVLSNIRDNFCNQFKLLVDINLIDQVTVKFENESFDSMLFENISFTKNGSFIYCNFFYCKFEGCLFDLHNFKNTSFTNCSFVNCKVTEHTNEIFSDSIFIFGCNDFESGFLEKFDYHYSNQPDQCDTDSDHDMERIIFEKLLRVGSTNPRTRALAQLTVDMDPEERNQMLKTIDKLCKRYLINIHDNRATITHNGVIHYKTNYKK